MAGRLDRQGKGSQQGAISRSGDAMSPLWLNFCSNSTVDGGAPGPARKRQPARSDLAKRRCHESPLVELLLEFYGRWRGAWPGKEKAASKERSREAAMP